MYHCGLLYRSGHEVRILHLAFHHDLRDEPPNNRYLWAEVPEEELDEDNAMALAAWARVVGERHPDISYGIDRTGVIFRPDGSLLPHPLGRGLTCATFVMAMFAYQMHYPLAEETWPQRETDRDWKAHVVGLLRKYNVAEEHVAEVERATVETRFRPEEVVGGATTQGWPKVYDQARPIAEAILKELEEAKL